MASSDIVVIVEVRHVRDAAAFDAYRAQARAQMLERGGQLVARGGTLFEGEPPLGLGILVQRWPSEEAFRSWQASEAYAPLLKIRRAVADLRITIAPVVT